MTQAICPSLKVIFLDVLERESCELIRSLGNAPIAPQFRHCDLTDLDAIAATFAAVGSLSRKREFAIDVETPGLPPNDIRLG
jgi:hypothetical protein